MLHNAMNNCLRMIRRGQWRLLAYVVSVKWHGLDITHLDVKALGLNAERSKAHDPSGGPALDRVCGLCQFPNPTWRWTSAAARVRHC
jgi:hypothetical protein